MSIKVDQRRAVFAGLKDYCMHSGDHDYMEVTEWSNGEGYDICILAWDTHNYLQSLNALMLRMALVDTLLLTVVVLVLAMWPKPSALEMLRSESFLEQQSRSEAN